MTQLRRSDLAGRDDAPNHMQHRHHDSTGSFDCGLRPPLSRNDAVEVDALSGLVPRQKIAQRFNAGLLGQRDESRSDGRKVLSSLTGTD